jgi:ubiquinone/menaquinone biosynthesis C-methylase UbiE
MNAGLENTLHPSIEYYDGDYPSREFSHHPENFDDTVELQGLAFDVEKYVSLANEFGHCILDVCCGTGRITLPLVKRGFQVTGVDFCQPLLDQLKTKRTVCENGTEGRLCLANQDVTRLNLPNKFFDLAVCGFNSLSCITSFEAQQEALCKIGEHVREGGLLALDLINPFVLNWAGDPAPKPFFTRKHPITGNVYTRFAAMGPLLVDQRQKLYGWYDEIDPDNALKRKLYEMYWRPVFRYEIQLMLEKAGFIIRAIYGGHRNEPFASTSRKMFIEAVKV